MSGNIIFNKQQDDAFSIKGGGKFRAYMKNDLQ
jgi:hypothetical protein